MPTEYDVETLKLAAEGAESWLTEFGADDSPDDGLRAVVRDLRIALTAFGIDRKPCPRCEVGSCDQSAEWEGWVRRLDPFTREPSGLIQRRNVCDEHRSILIGD